MTGYREEIEDLVNDVCFLISPVYLYIAAGVTIIRETNISGTASRQCVKHILYSRPELSYNTDKYNCLYLQYTSEAFSLLTSHMGLVWLSRCILMEFTLKPLTC